MVKVREETGYLNQSVEKKLQYRKKGRKRNCSVTKGERKMHKGRGKGEHYTTTRNKEKNIKMRS